AAGSLAQDHRLAALVAGVLGGPAGQHRLAGGVEVHRRLALGIAAAAQERAALAHALEHRLAALRAGVLGLDGSLSAGVAFARLSIFALRVAGAAIELTRLAETHHQRLFALRALFAGLDAFERLHFRFGD